MERGTKEDRIPSLRDNLLLSNEACPMFNRDLIVFKLPPTNVYCTIRTQVSSSVLSPSLELPPFVINPSRVSIASCYGLHRQ